MSSILRSKSIGIIAFTPIQHRERIRNDVWKVTFTDGQRVIWKVVSSNGGYNRFRAEVASLRYLKDADCSVPMLLDMDEGKGIIVTEWCGDETVDEICLSSDVQRFKIVGQQFIEEFSKIEHAFRESWKTMTDLAFKRDLNDEGEKILRRGKLALLGLIRLAGGRLGEVEMQRLDDLWHQIGETILAGPATFGSCDYNALNIVVDGQNKVTFIDFSLLGHDWPERRLVQYTTGLGTYRTGSGGDGKIAGLLSEELAGQYAEKMTDNPKMVLRRLDCHHLLFYLMIVADLIEMIAAPERQRSKLLREAWGEPRARIGQVVQGVLKPLSRDKTMIGFRSMLKDVLLN